MDTNDLLQPIFMLRSRELIPIFGLGSCSIRVSMETYVYCNLSLPMRWEHIYLLLLAVDSLIDLPAPFLECIAADKRQLVPAHYTPLLQQASCPLRPHPQVWQTSRPSSVEETLPPPPAQCIELGAEGVSPKMAKDSLPSASRSVSSSSLLKDSR